METITPKTEKLLSAFCGLVFAVPAASFGYLTLLLFHLFVTSDVPNWYMSTELWLATIGLPSLSLALTALSCYFFRIAFGSPALK